VTSVEPTVTVVVPYRGAGAKSRLGRPEIAQAMLEDVLRAAAEVGEVVVANGAGGQGAAVAETLARTTGPVLVVNADLPCATADDLRALAAATPPDGAAIVAAADGTTNAISLARAELFEPLYGPGSAERYRERGAVAVAIPNLVDDVDTADDLERVADRVGPSTRAAL
jgi:2-phospho-L-lactate guanylyltransferase (CobY/MobA/RfbA family)